MSPTALDTPYGLALYLVTLGLFVATLAVLALDALSLLAAGSTWVSLRWAFALGGGTVAAFALLVQHSSSLRLRGDVQPAVR